jgi:riboflavin biosynthesis pyrimidine reductase
VNLYRVLPPPVTQFDLSVDEDRARLIERLHPPGTSWIRAVMVTSSAGDIVGKTGTSAGLTKGSDRALLKMYRDLADVVVVGANTVRLEKVPTPTHTPLAVVSQSGDLSGHQIALSPEGSLIVITGSTGARKVAETLLHTPHTTLVIDTEGPLSAGDIHDVLKNHLGAQHFLIEGGRALWESFVDVIDEIALSVAPPPTKDQAGIPPWWPRPTQSWTLAELLTDDAKMLYYRYLTGIRGESS